MKISVCGVMAVGIGLTWSAAALAADPAATCEASKLGTSAKYAQCRLKADSKSAKTGDPADYSKCNLEKFGDAQDKATAAGGACPTTDDQANVTTYIDSCTARVATWLGGGGGLPDTCSTDLATCETDLSTCDADLSECEAGPNGKVSRTGQTTCYSMFGSVMSCAGSGQDGELQKGLARSFTDNGDGTITDDNTGLVWEKLSDDGSIHDYNGASYATSDAYAKVSTLNSMAFAGYTDWRVPNITELQTLVNYGATNPAAFPAFNNCAPGCTVLTCNCTSPFRYLTSTTAYNDTTTNWNVDFTTGMLTQTGKLNGALFRAVRGGS